MNKWNDLSIRDKAAYIKAGVKNGLTNINDISKAYNSFAEGGSLQKPFSYSDIPEVRYAGGGPLSLVKKAFAPTYEGSFSEAFVKARENNKDYFRWNDNLYNSKLDTEVFKENNPTNFNSGYAEEDAARRIMQYENSKNNPKGGYNRNEDKWYPHTSVEGGAKTIAYGIKLSNGTDWAKTAIEQGYLTDKQANQAVIDLTKTYMQNAKVVYDRKYGKGAFDNLSEKSKSILTDFEYNPGLKRFPKLMEGFYNGDLDTIGKNSKRYVTTKKNGKTIRRELGRNKAIQADLDSLAKGFYPLYK